MGSFFTSYPPDAHLQAQALGELEKETPLSPSLPWLDLEASLRAIHLSPGYPHCLAFLQTTQDTCTPGVHPGKSYLPPLCNHPLMQPHLSVPWIDRPAVACPCGIFFVSLATLGGHRHSCTLASQGRTLFLPSFVCLSVYISLGIPLNFLKAMKLLQVLETLLTSNPPLVFTTEMQRYWGPAPASCKAPQVHVTS